MQSKVWGKCIYLIYNVKRKHQRGYKTKFNQKLLQTVEKLHSNKYYL